MNRLLVTLLSAFDATITAVVGLAAALAPLTLLWVFGFGGSADWGALWPTSARVWELGHLVPLHIDLPATYLAATGIPPEAASFAFSLAPLAFAAFTAISAARSARRAAQAGAWGTGVVAGTATFAAIAAAVAVTSASDIVWVQLWQAILLPAVVFAVPAVLSGIVGAWRDGDGGLVDLVSDAVHPRLMWRDVPAAATRGLGAALMGWIGVGAAVLAVAFAVGAGSVVALFETAHVDLVGAITVAIGQLAYLPTLVVWAAAYASGPGVALGVGSTVSPAGTDIGVLPGVPALGIIPADPSPWLLLLALAVVGIGALAGWIARRRLLVGDAGHAGAPRAVVLALIAGGSAGGAALLAAVAAGYAGPGRLELVGPQAGAVALAVGVEIAIGAAITLFAPLASAGDDRGDRGEPIGGQVEAPWPADREPAASPAVAFVDFHDGTPDPDATSPLKPLPAAPDPDATAPIEPLEPADDDAEPDGAGDDGGAGAAGKRD